MEHNWPRNHGLMKAKNVSEQKIDLQDAQCVRLVLVGGGRAPPQGTSWGSLVQQEGPLTFALFAEAGLETGIERAGVTGPQDLDASLHWSLGPKCWKDQELVQGFSKASLHTMKMKPYIALYFIRTGP